MTIKGVTNVITMTNRDHMTTKEYRIDGYMHD